MTPQLRKLDLPEILMRLQVDDEARKDKFEGGERVCDSVKKWFRAKSKSTAGASRVARNLNLSGATTALLRSESVSILYTFSN